MSSPTSSLVQASDYPRLDNKQLGHLCHFHNLVTQKDGDWHYFGTEDGHDELTTPNATIQPPLADAAGAAHYHRLPALRGPFRSLMRQMIYKMLLRDAWSYWFLAIHGGKVFDPDFRSGGEGEYHRDSVVFRWEPLFSGLGSEEFRYDNRRLADVILQQMEDNEWLGVCCEPNADFVVCNQFPLIAMRYNDVRDGTNIIEDHILPKYRAALQAKGMLGSDGLYASFFAVKPRKAIPARRGAHTAWSNAFMHAWNPEFVENSYDTQTLGFLTHYDSKTQLQPTKVAQAFRTLVTEDGHDPNDRSTLLKARETSRDFKSKIPFETRNWLSFTMMLSELGKTKELEDLLEYADTHLNPTWVDGGLDYPRNSQLQDNDWNLTHVEPHSGNSGIGYARLNVPNGQKTMWEKPWTREILANRPWIDDDGFSDDLDFSRAVWDETRSAMVISARRWRGEQRLMTLQIRNLPEATWEIFVNGRSTTDGFKK